MSGRFQDTLGQLPILKSYTHILLCFALPDENRKPVIDGVQSASLSLLEAFPFLAGRVVHRDIQAGCSGHFTVQVEPDTGDQAQGQHSKSGTDGGDPSILRINYLSQPSYASLRSARCSSAQLPGGLLAPPRPAFPEPYSNDSLAAVVLDIQANFLPGGLLLDLAAQHNIIDATGIFHIARLLAQVMKSHVSTPAAVSISESVIQEGNRDRRSLIPLLSAEEEVPASLISRFKPPTRPAPLDRATLAQNRWHWVHFPPSTIATLYEEANRHPEDFPSTSITSVSVNDALTAFCWRGLIRARFNTPSSPLSSFPSPTKAEEEAQTQTQISRAIDLRRTLFLTEAYMGHMVRTANLRLPITTVHTSSLSYLAGALRKSAREHATPQAIREYASLIAREPDKGKIAYAGGFNPRTDFSCSSVAHVKLDEFDFGEGLGRPEFMRRPTFGPLPGAMYIGPGGLGGGLDGVICVSEKEMDGLREGWGGLVEYIG